MHTVSIGEDSMDLEIQVSKIEDLRKDLNSAGLGDNVRVHRGDAGVLLLALGTAAQSAAAWGKDILKFGQALAPYLHRTQEHVVVKHGTLELDITTSNLEQSLTTLRRHKVIG